METPEPARLGGAIDQTVGGEVVEIRPSEVLRVCPNCLVSNTRDNRFCTGCGTQLPRVAGVLETEDAGPQDEDAPEPVRVSTPTLISPPVPRSAFAPEPSPERQLRGAKLVATLALLVAAVAALVAFAALWQTERSHANRLQTDLAQSQLELASTKTKLRATQARLTSATSLSDKRRAVLLQAQDVVAKVDPLLSSVDNIQARAGNLASQGSTVTEDADSFISTVTDLVNYLVRSSGGYVDAAWVGQQIDTANSQLATLGYDESSFGSGYSSYGNASKSFGVKADAFSASVRALQKQLKTVTSK
jgi:hypothetical protein